MTTSGDTGLVSDSEILAESLANPERFSALVDAHNDIIFRYLARRVGASMGEDLAAETFLRAFRARAGYRGSRSSALPWLYGIATNLLRDHARSEHRQTQALAKLAGHAVREAGSEDCVDDALTAAARLRHVAAAIGALTPDARDVLVLIAVEGLSYQDAAIALGVPDGTVRSRLSRARLELRRSIARLPPSEVPQDPPAAECEKGISRG
jgi:RNA polymerase sigma factor (sigma-70 family)